MERKIQLEHVPPKSSAPNANTETRYRVLFGSGRPLTPAATAASRDR